MQSLEIIYHHPVSAGLLMKHWLLVLQNKVLVMADDKMIQYLQNRFGLSKVQASVIYYKLEKYFTKSGKNP